MYELKNEEGFPLSPLPRQYTSITTERRIVLMNIVFIGPSGAGKGTQAERIAAQFNLIHIASGDLFRQNLEAKTELGLLAQEYMARGELVPDEVTEAMIGERLHEVDPPQGVILDGFPRTKYQAKTLDEIFNELGWSTDVVIYLKVSDEEIITHRIPGRLTCKKCQRPYHEIHNPPRTPFICDRCGGELYRRDDDTPKRSRERLKVFHRQTAPRPVNW
jgi:adenylate kinase